MAALLQPGTARAGDLAQWAYVNGTWIKPYQATGDFTHGIAAYGAGGIPGKALALTDGASAIEYVREYMNPGQYDPTGLSVAANGIRDVASDDVLNGARIFVTDADGAREYRYYSGAWNPESVIATGSGFTAGDINYLQDRFWAVQNGTIYEYNRTSGTTWAQNGDVFAGNYLDLAVKSQPGSAIVFGLRADGFDEFQGGQMVRSHNNLFSDATGIATWSDQDNLFVSTTSGLLWVRRDSGLSFTPAGVSVIDESSGYLDVETITDTGGTDFDIWAVQVPEPATLLVLLAGGVLLARRRH